MNRIYRLCLPLLATLLCCACQSLEQLSIDYMMPAEISFPPQIKKIGLVNNLPEDHENDSNTPVIPLLKNQTHYQNGNPRITLQALAQSLADARYFETIVICDSALRTGDKLPRETTLSQQEVQTLSQRLGVDAIVSLERLQLKSSRKMQVIPEYNIHYGSIDVQVFPRIKVYQPARSRPMASITCHDSIYWDAYGGSEQEVLRELVTDDEMIRQASEFAGTLPTPKLTPHWLTSQRFYYAGGSLNMRDAKTYVKEQHWEEAGQLWLKEYEHARNKKRRMRAAYNLALYYEMNDSIDQACNYAAKAQQLAKEVDNPPSMQITEEMAPNLFLATLYLQELEQRKQQMMSLNAQMKRFDGK